MRWPVAEAVAIGVASGVTIGLLVLPPTPYLAAWLRLPTLGLAALWLIVRLVLFDTALRQWRAWQTTPDWVMTSAEAVKKGGAA
jgi:hypothetical protein